MPPTAHSRRPRLAVAAILLALGLGIAAPATVARAGADEAARLVAEANRKIRQRDVSTALKLLEQAVASDPTSVDAHVRYQDTYRDALGVQQVLAKYQAAAREKPADPVAQFLGARLLPPAEAAAAMEHLAQQFRESPWPSAGRARALEELGRFADAATAHAEAVARAGANAPRFLAYRAYSYERGEQWAMAVDAWNAVITKTPGDLSAHLGLSEALRKSEQTDAALAALDAAARVGASEPEVAYRRGLVQMDVGQWEKALAAFDAALSIDRGMLEALCAASDASVKFAKAKADSEKRDLAVEDLDKAISYGDRATISFPDAPFGHFVLGAAHESVGWLVPDHYTTALKEYDAALERLPIPGPDKVAALTAKAFVLVETEQFDAAVETAQKAIDIDKSCLVAYGHAGFALSAQGKLQDAINRFHKPALKIDPKCARILHDMGVALWELKKPNDARKPLEEARTAEPDVGRYRLTLGALYYELKRNKEAVAELFEATELLPRDIEAWRYYGKACWSLKSWDECAKAYEKVCELDAKATDEHLYLAVLYADMKKDKEKAKAHALKYRENGGSDPNLDDWMNSLLGGDTPPNK